MEQRRLDLNLRQSTKVSTFFIFSYLFGGQNTEEKRGGAFKSKREGYALFKATHVLDGKFNSSHDNFCFFDERFKASMTRNKIYWTKV